MYVLLVFICTRYEMLYFQVDKYLPAMRYYFMKYFTAKKKNEITKLFFLLIRCDNNNLYIIRTYLM